MADPIAAPAPAPTPAPAAAAPAPAPAAAPAADPTPSILSAPSGGDPAPAADPAAPQGDWPSDWRTRLAGSDEKALKRLERFAAPTDIFKSFRALEQRMSSGELKANVPFPEKGTDDDKNAWRKEQGIPDTPAAYLEKLPEGLVIGEDDKATMTKFAERMHGKNAPPALVHEAIAAYYATREDAIAQLATKDTAWRQETEDALRGDWGNEYRPNVTRLGQYLDSMGELGQRIKGARLADGRPLFADPEATRYFMSMVNELEPAVTLVPNSGGDAGQAIATELAGLKKEMGNPDSSYWKGPEASAKQERYRKLVEGQAKLQKKAA